jgi:hypothetical protein
MIDFTIFYKKKYKPSDNWFEENQWDIFISAFNSSERVQTIFQQALAKEKHWLIFPDYEYTTDEYPSSGTCFNPTSTNEAEFIQEYFNKNAIDLNGLKIGIDITGFMRPHLMYLIQHLWRNNICKFDVIYTDPTLYKKKEETKFSDEIVLEVRQIAGFEGDHITDLSNDVLIIASGYDHQLIAQVAENKAKSKKIQIFGLPSLQADMYQENVLRASLVSESTGNTIESERYFAPAYDPFVTASVLQELVNKLNTKKRITNLYLSPLSTKAQVLGFVLYYLTGKIDVPTSIIFPISAKYTRETSKGISKIWKYSIELPLFS